MVAGQFRGRDSLTTLELDGGSCHTILYEKIPLVDLSGGDQGRPWARLLPSCWSAKVQLMALSDKADEEVPKLR